MNLIPNSLSARDVATLVHPQTNLRRHLEQGPFVLERGGGAWKWDDDGNAMLDAVSGLWCASLGFAPERLAKVAFEQMNRMAYAHLYRHNSHEPAIELAEKLLSIAPQTMSKVHFQSTGSEANDVAIKLVWYYHNAIGKPEKCKIISRLGGYHGSTVAAVSLSGKRDMHAQFNLPLPGFLHAECPYYYRDARDGESEEDYATRLAADLEALIEREGPETIGAFFAEPAMGSSGALMPPKTYFEKLQAVLRKHEILLVADEVICGFGRTGEMWGHQTFGFEPDMMTCAKALSAGALPISALLVSEKIYRAMLDQSDATGSFAHGHTYAGHPVCAAVALETLKIYEELDLVPHVNRLGGLLGEALDQVADHPMVGGIDRAGMMAGIELVRDRERREHFAQDANIALKVAEASQRHGLVHRFAGQRIAFAPAYVMTDDDIAQIGVRLRRSLDEVWAAVSD